MTLRYLEAAPATVAQQNARLWTVYEAEQRAARKLRPEDSLDTRAGVPLPLAQAITNGDNGYVLPIESDDRAIAALPLDAYALAAQGRGGVDLTGNKDATELDTRLRVLVDGSRVATSTADAPLGEPRSR